MAYYIESDDVGLARFFAGLNDQDRVVSDMKRQWIRDNTADPTFFQGLIDRGIVEHVFYGQYLAPVGIQNPITSVCLGDENSLMLVLSNPLGMAKIYTRENDYRRKLTYIGEGNTPGEILGPVESLDPKSVDATDRGNIRYCVSQVLALHLDAQKRDRLLDLVRELEHRENRDPSEPASYLDLVYSAQN